MRPTLCIARTLAALSALIVLCAACEESTPQKPANDVDLTLPAYRALEDLTVQGWCGPSALTWIYSGLYSAYQDQPLAAARGVLYDYILANYTRPIQWQAQTQRYMLPQDLRVAFEDVTRGEYTITDVSLRDGAARAWLENNALPLLSLTATPAGLHWRVVYGVYYSATDGIHYYRLHDNGQQGPAWIESDRAGLSHLALCGVLRRRSAAAQD